MLSAQPPSARLANLLCLECWNWMVRGESVSLLLIYSFFTFSFAEYAVAWVGRQPDGAQVERVCITLNCRFWCTVTSQLIQSQMVIDMLPQTSFNHYIAFLSLGNKPPSSQAARTRAICAHVTLNEFNLTRVSETGVHYSLNTCQDLMWSSDVAACCSAWAECSCHTHSDQHISLG